MVLTEAALTWVAVGAAALGALALLVALHAHRRQRVLLRRFRVLWGDGSADVATVLAQQDRRMSEAADRVNELESLVHGLGDTVAQTLQHVAVVRYDAFGDMGGRMSFSAAVLDDRGDGMVLSSIHARGESRTYAKAVLGGRSEVTLTPEEQQALAAARGGD